MRVAIAPEADQVGSWYATVLLGLLLQLPIYAVLIDSLRYVFYKPSAPAFIGRVVTKRGGIVWPHVTGHRSTWLGLDRCEEVLNPLSTEDV